MKKGKKCICVMISLVLATGIFASCSKKNENGTIEDVQLNTQTEEQKQPDNKFIKLESPYTYEYGSFSIKKAHMRFDVPKTWETEFVNSRYAVIQTPSDDPYLPATTISILIDYGEDISENEMSQYTMNNHAYYFSEFFKQELEGLPTYTDGMTRHLRSYVAEDDIRNGPDFVPEDHPEDASTLISYDVVLVDKTNKYYIDEYSMVSTYLKWDDSPVCINAIVSKNKYEKAAAMMEYMASSITYDKGIADGYKEISYKDFHTDVPSTFTPINGAENIYMSSLYENSESSGISVGVFTVEEKNKDTLTAENIAGSYAQTIATLAFSPYDTNAIFGVQAHEIDNNSGPDYSGTIGVDCTSFDEPTEIAGSLFGPYAYYMGDYYIVEKSDKSFIVAVIYQECQKSIARDIGKTAVRKLEVI